MAWKPRGRRQLFFSLGVATARPLFLCNPASKQISLIALFFSPALQIYLLAKEAVNLSGLLFSFVLCSEECGNSSLDGSALSLRSVSNSKPSFSRVTSTQPLRIINLPVHPPTLTLQTLWSFPEEKKQKQRNKTELCTSCQPQATVEKTYYSPRPHKRPHLLEIPILPAAPVLVPVRP
ncbi:hypothetical protein CHARACLAT_018817 [Characodon lateralis]|uniref:Uncharacterized protein n=1 Tax=Characodon lateralis TaxID=208331 RepID=A0ABU7D1S2_9TELE|nr:hypothetical protein [Characodon lateralis]